MKKNLIILTEWSNEKQFHRLRHEIEDNLSGVESFSYLVWINKPKLIEALPQIKNVCYLSKKDLSFFDRLNNKEIKAMLQKTSSTALVIALEKNEPFLKRILKSTTLTTIGLENESLLKFDLAFEKTTLKEGEFFKKLDNYINKIQL